MKKLDDESRIEKLTEEGEILPHEGGRRFYFRSKSPKAVAKRKKARRQRRKSRKR